MNINGFSSCNKNAETVCNDAVKTSPYYYKAFTLIELLVVIAIIGILSTFAIVALGNARAKGRDSKRLNDMRSMVNALELYYANHNSYPPSLTPGQLLENGGIVYMNKVPENPTPRTDGGCADQEYRYYNHGSDFIIATCLGSSQGQFAAGSFLSSSQSVGIVSPFMNVSDVRLVLSLRKVVPAYQGPALRIRRSSDSAEQDINFVNGKLDEESLLAFVGSGSGYIRTWYDQSGGNRNAQQSSTTQQPLLVVNGQVNKQAGYPFIDFDGVNDVMSISSIALPSNPLYSLTSVNRYSGTNNTFFSAGSVFSYSTIFQSASGWHQSPFVNNNNRYIYTIHRYEQTTFFSGFSFWRNGSQISPSTSGTNSTPGAIDTIFLGGINATPVYPTNVKYEELILTGTVSSDQSLWLHQAVRMYYGL